MRHLEFWFDVGSPAAYLAWTQLPGLVARTGVEIAWRPMLLGGVFQATGNASPMVLPAKAAYSLRDFRRFADRYGVALTISPHFPINTLGLMRGAVVADRDGFLDAYLKAVFEAIFVEGLNLNELDVVSAVLDSADGVHAGAIAAGIEEPDIRDRLKALTAEAVERGIFGAPSFFVGEELFFGQDRLPQVEETLGR